MLKTYLHRDITHRLPYSIVQEVIIQEDTRGLCSEFVHKMDKPFHIQVIIAKLTALDETGRIIDPAPTCLDSLIELQAIQFSMNESFGNQLLMQRLGNNMISWTPKSDLVLTRAEGFQMFFGGRKSYAINGAVVPVKAVLTQLALEGETLVLAPPGYTKNQD